MCLLSDCHLEARLSLLTPQRIVVAPLGEDAVQPSSIDLRLGEEMFLLLPKYGVVHPYNPNTFSQIVVPFEDTAQGEEKKGWLLKPGLLYLATSLEEIHVPDDLTGKLSGKSTRARVGIVPHQQAGFLDAGWWGRPTFELTVVYPTMLFPGMSIAQVEFTTMSSPAARPYGHRTRRSRYQGDMAPTMARPLPPATLVHQATGGGQR